MPTEINHRIAVKECFKSGRYLMMFSYVDEEKGVIRHVRFSNNFPLEDILPAIEDHELAFAKELNLDGE